jgi:endoglycosylceramidase
MKSILFTFTFMLLLLPGRAQVPYAIRDGQGRHVVPRGFVVNTEDSRGDIFYTPEDYYRMVRMGANFQVIRLKLGRLGGYPGNGPEPSYLLHLDSLVQMGKNAGIRTDFKLTVYGTTGFSWGNFWRNENGEFDHLEKAWRLLWERYRNEPAVYGYDLLNEPMKGDLDVGYEEMESAYLIPLYQRLVDACHGISPHKKCLYQAILVNNPDREIYHPPFISMKTPLKGENIMYAPHIYEGDKSRIRSWFDKYYRDAAVSGVPIFFGEWGPATYDPVDSSLTEQFRYQDFYIETAHIFDSLGVGTAKAWFTGTRFTGKSGRGPFTWSIFKDNRGVGTVERKYITDIIARPYPQCIAGDIMEFSVDFPTRSLHLEIRSENSKGASRIFIPADRLYPDGFTLTAGETVVIFNPIENTGLEVIEPGRGITPADFIWDPFRQQLVVLQWPVDGTRLRVSIQPGIYQEILPRE